MKAIIEFLVLIFYIGILFGCVICIVWFCYAMIVNFWNIYIKNNVQKPVKKCVHQYRFDDLNPNLPWHCVKCDRNFK